MYIITATGKQLETNMVIALSSPELLYIRILNKTLKEIAEIFSNDAEIKTLSYQDTIYENYIVSAIIKEKDAYRINLIKDNTKKEEGGPTVDENVK